MHWAASEALLLADPSVGLAADFGVESISFLAADGDVLELFWALGPSEVRVENIRLIEAFVEKRRETKHLL